MSEQTQQFENKLEDHTRLSGVPEVYRTYAAFTVEAVFKRSYVVGGSDGPVVRSRDPEMSGMAFKRLPAMV